MVVLPADNLADCSTDYCRILLLDFISQNLSLDPLQCSKYTTYIYYKEQNVIFRILAYLIFILFVYK